VDDQAGETGIGHQHVRTLAQHENGDLTTKEGALHRQHVLFGACFYIEGRGPTDAVGSELPQGMIVADPTAE
jgi:hypothetical protein